MSETRLLKQTCAAQITGELIRDNSWHAILKSELITELNALTDSDRKVQFFQRHNDIAARAFPAIVHISFISGVYSVKRVPGRTCFSVVYGCLCRCV